MSATLHHGIFDEVIPCKFKDGGEFYKLVFKSETGEKDYLIVSAYSRKEFSTLKVSLDLFMITVWLCDKDAD